MNIDNDQLDAFLIEAQLINQKVKDLAENKLSPEEFDRLEVLRAEDKRKRQQVKQKKIQQAYQKRIDGRDGKGIGKNFVNFCRSCHKEYQFPTQKCLKCKRKTMTLEQRQKQLEIMVEDYKKNKIQREDKKQKWEMWQKTQAMSSNRNSINYKKWDYFVSDSEEEQDKDPILPTNDPNFKALEMDMEERKKKRKKDTNEAKRLKEKGNVAMKQGDYQKAMQMYTLALEHIKDMKSIYTNRALAFIRLKKYSKAIKDCTNVIEFMEVFEKIGENRDLAFKAFSRRALANKQLKQYHQALLDVEQAIKLFPQQKSAQLMKGQIQGFIQHSQKVEKILRQNQKLKAEASQIIEEKTLNQEGQEKEEKQQEELDKQANERDKQIIRELVEEQLNQNKEEQLQKSKEQKQQKQSKQQKQQKLAEKQKVIFQKQTSIKANLPENPIEEIQKRVKSITTQNVNYLFELLIRKKQMREIFISSKGIEACLESLISSDGTKKEAILISYCLDKDAVGEKRVWDFGVNRLHNRIKQSLEHQTQLNSSIYQKLEDIFEVLIKLSLHEPYRVQLSNSKEIFEFVEYTYTKLLSKYKKQTLLLELFLTYFGNLCSGESQLKNTLIDKKSCLVFFESIYLVILDHKTKNKKIISLKQVCYSLLSNLVANLQHRRTFIEFANQNNRFDDLKEELEYFPRSAINFDDYIQNVLSLLVNVSLETKLQLPDLTDIIFNRFVLNFHHFNAEIIHRSLLILSRFKYANNSNSNKWMNTFALFAEKQKPLINSQQKNMVQIVKILNVLFEAAGPEIQRIPDKLYVVLVKFVGDNLVHENLFCNTALLFGVIIGRKSNLGKELLKEMKKAMERLVEIAKEKTGNWRKSAAILIAKCSHDEACKEEMKKWHGMDVLKSIASFVTDKK